MYKLHNRAAKFDSVVNDSPIVETLHCNVAMKLGVLHGNNLVIAEKTNVRILATPLLMLK
jgi:hypothetical protein